MKNFFGRIITFTMIAVLCLSFSACGNGAGTGETPLPPVQKQPMEFDSFISKLNGSYYTDESLADSADFYGLSAPENVGINKAAALENLYPVPDDAEFEQGCIFNTADYGVTANDDINDFEGFTQAVEAAKAKSAESGKNVKIKLPAGNLNFTYTSDPGWAFKLNGAQNLYFEGNGTVINIDIKRTLPGGFLLDNCENIHFNGISLDYKYPNTVTGLIKSMNPSTREIEIELAEEFLEVAAIWVEHFETNAKDISYLEYNKYTLAPHESSNYYNYMNSFGVLLNPLAQCTLDENILTLKINTGQYTFFTAAVNHYAVMIFGPEASGARHGFTVTSSKNVYFEDVNVYHSPGMAYTSSRSENMYYNRANAMRRPETERLFSSGRDGMHFSNVLGDLHITNGLYEYCGDDTINVKSGFYLDIISIITEGIAKNITVAGNPSVSAPKIGEPFAIYKKSNLEVAATGTVRNFTVGFNQYSIVYSITEGSLDEVNTTDYTFGYTRRSPDFKFNNNLTRNKLGKGMLVQIAGTPEKKAEIKNNVFAYVAWGGVEVHSIYNHYAEAGMPSYIEISGNKFINNNSRAENPGDIHVMAKGDNDFAPAGSITGVDIKNNFIWGASNSGVAMYSVSDTKVESNLFIDCADKFNSDFGNSTFHISGSKDVTVAKNFNQNYLAKDADYSPVKDAGNQNIVYSGNTGLEQSAEVASVKILKAASAINIDGNLNDWSGSGTDIPLRGATMGSYMILDYESFFKIKTLKMTWDDNGMYFAFDIYDKTITWEQLDSFWLGDCLEMMFTSVYDRASELSNLVLDGPTFEYIIGPGDTSAGGSFDPQFWPLRTSSEIQARSAQVNTKAWQTNEGYAAEGFIPFAALNMTGLGGENIIFKELVDDGAIFAVSFAFNDNDNGGRLQAGNVSHNVEHNKRTPTGMMKIKFVNE